MRLDITKVGQQRVEIEEETGYYALDGAWCRTRGRTIVVQADALMFLMGQKATRLGLTTSDTVLGFLDKLVYGVISGQIPVVARLTASAVDPGTGQAVPGARVRVSRAGLIALDAALPVTGVEIPLLLGATVEFTAPGYAAVTQARPALAGPVTIRAEMVPDAGFTASEAEVVA